MDKELLNILLAEDDEADRILFLEAFELLKIKSTIHIVNDGVELMDYLTKKNDTLPDLIFLDLNMPRKGGLECLKEIRANEKFKGISVAIYSTSSAERDISDTFLNGANVYIQKPSDFNELTQVLAKAVSAASVYKDPPFNINNFLLRI